MRCARNTCTATEGPWYPVGDWFVCESCFAVLKPALVESTVPPVHGRCDTCGRDHDERGDITQYVRVLSLLRSLDAKLDAMLIKEDHVSGEVEALKAAVADLQASAADSGTKIDAATTAMNSATAALDDLAGKIANVTDLSALPALAASIGEVANGLRTKSAALATATAAETDAVTRDDPPAPAPAPPPVQ